MGETCEPLHNLKEVYELMTDPPKWGLLTSSRSSRTKAVPNSSLYVDGNACHVPLRAGLPSADSDLDLPKTLVCHDMKGGYQDDRYIDGSEDHSAYLFYHWSAIDIFVYFSHHFVTIPPLCWINIAHKHGVQILGTIITEWDSGSKICNEFLETEEEYRKFAHHLVSIARHFKLDGWLLNIENDIEKVDNLVEFIKHLTNLMHEFIPNSIVIWYDSVTKSGILRWQNTLNEKNRIFFDSCDGIFTNYCWSPSQLKDTLVEAGERKHDVYIGIDVWGRNFWGGGCFNTASALKEIHNNGLSVAIFAPAWTHEAIRIEEMDQINHKVKPELCDSEYSIFSKTYDAAFESEKLCMKRCYFLMRENTFWNSLWPYLNTRGPTKLPFHTFFCIGSGKMKRVNGMVIRDKPWFNLREQQYQLSIPMCPVNTFIEKVAVPIRDEKKKKNAQPEYDFKMYPNVEQEGCLTHYTKDSFHGGNCVKVSPSKSLGRNVIIRLFLCEFKCKKSFVVYFVFKRLNGTDQNLDLLLTMKNNATNSKFLANLCASKAIRNSDPFHFSAVDLENDGFKSLKNNLKLYHPGYYISNLSNGWEVKYFHVKVPDSTISDINCKLTNETGEILLGGLGIVKDIPLT